MRIKKQNIQTYRSNTKLLARIREACTMLYPESISNKKLPLLPIKTKVKTFSHRNSLDFESQIINEVRKEQKAVTLGKRISNSRRPTHIIIDEPNTIEEINKWEFNNIRQSQKEADYGIKLRNNLKKYVETNLELMLKNDWVRDSKVIKESVQLFHDTLVKSEQGFDKRSSLPIIHPPHSVRSTSIIRLKR